MPTITYTETLVTEICWCGINHAIPANLARRAADEGVAVFCPLGHEWVVKESRAKKLERQLEEQTRRTKAARDLLRQEERSHAATRGHVTRMKKRASAGVCPCCNRTFQQLSRHMANKHPDFPKDTPS